MGIAYHKYIAKGRCGQCGKLNDRKNRKTCSACAKKDIEYQTQAKRFALSIGICPKCKKNKLFGDERSCPECKAVDASCKSKAREEHREEFNEYMRNYHKIQYQKRKEQGVCTRCGKRNAVNGTRCEYCKGKAKQNNTGAFNGEKRVSAGLCYWCGKPQKPGYKICEKHYQMNVEKARSKKAKEAREQLVESRILY